jgi:hypothetical protein
MAMAQKGWIISVIISDHAKVTTVVPIPMPNSFAAGTM